MDFIAGCLGGCAGVIIGHPFDTVKVKLQTQDYKNPVYRGTWDCFSKILKTESVAGVYKGVTSPMAGVAVVNAIVFGVHGNMQRSMTDPDSLRSHFLAGAIAGLVQSVVASPVELVKTRVQTSGQYRSPMDCFRKIYQQEGVRGVFKGLGITAVREFLGYGLYFATYEALTRTSPEEAPVGTACMLLAGGLAGTVSWVVTYPLDVIKTRFQADTGKYSGMADCIKQSIRDEGLMCLTKGLTPTIIRAFPTNAVTFTVVTWVFRLAEFDSGTSGNMKENINRIFDSLLKQEKYVLKSVDLVEAPINKIEISSFFKERLRKHFLITEDFWVNDEGDEFCDDLRQASPSRDMSPQENQNGMDAELSGADLNEIDTFMNTNIYERHNKTAPTKEEYKKVPS